MDALIYVYDYVMAVAQMINIPDMFAWASD